MMRKILIWIISIGALLGLGFFGYRLLRGGGAAPKGSLSTLSGAAGSQAIAGRAFLKTLGSIENLQLDTSIFQEPAYTNLVSFGIELQQQPKGRRNPFAPIGTEENL